MTEASKPKKTSNSLLRKAARLWGLQTGYKAVGDKYVEASESGLINFLSLLSETEPDQAAANHDEWLRGLIARVHADRVARVLEPVQVLWANQPRRFTVTVPHELVNRPFRYSVKLESGETKTETTVLEPYRRILASGVEAGEQTKFVCRARVEIPFDLPNGYHEVVIEDLQARGFLLSAPRRVDTTETRPQGGRQWGLFAPLYGLRGKSESGQDWGIGDLTLMGEAQATIRKLGGSFYGTLPMLASAGGAGEYDPSPYSPVSRLFWNEIFLDVESLVKKSKSPKGEAILRSPEFQAELERVRATTFVEYPSVFKLKKDVLKVLSREFFEEGGADRAPFRDFLVRTPLAKTYAEYRAQGDAAERDYQMYVQYEMDAQLTELNQRAIDGRAAELYLDFPVGVARGGFDTTHFQSSFLTEVTAGAPPDAFFSGGQNWGFSPFHPIKIREEGYRYFASSLRNHMRFGKILRLDHIMGLHRIYAIADGSKPTEGVYLRFKTDEFFACLMIEAECAGVRVVGENLGTVPDAVGQALISHDCLGMWVLPFEAGHDPAEAIAKMPASNLACLNTHDMVPFKGHIEVRDLDLFEKLGVLDPEQGQELKKERKASLKDWVKKFGTADEHALFKRITELLAESPAELLLVNLEDLWDETEPQNIPGTWKEYPNWRKKLKFTNEEWTRNEAVTSLLKELTTLRLRARQSEPTESIKDKENVAAGNPTSATL